MGRPPLKDSAVQPVGATISAADLVGLLIGSDRLRLQGFDQPAEHEELPVWAPQVSASGAPGAVRLAHERVRRFRRLALVLAAVMLGLGGAVVGWVAGQMAQEVRTAPVQPPPPQAASQLGGKMP